MKKIIVFIAALFFMITPALAGKDEKINELVKLVYYQTFADSMKPVLPKIISPIECGFQLDEAGKQKLSEETEKALLTYVTGVSAIFKTYFEQNFTEAEIDELLSFYKSQTMQKMMALTPVIMKESYAKMDSLNKGMVMNLLSAVQELSKKYPERSKAEQQVCMQEKQRSW